MARQDAELTIDHGPSKLDLMLSLFDTDMGVRTVGFNVGGQFVQDDMLGWYEVQIISARRRHPSATIWEIEGIVETKRGKERVSIYYQSDTRKGRMRFETGLRIHGIMETPDDAKRAKALMIVIKKIIAMYQNSHSGNLNEEIFILFEKAKSVHYAGGRDSLDEAIKNI